MKPQRSNLGSVTPQSLNDWLRNHSRVLGGQVSFGGTMSNKEQDRNLKVWKSTGTTPGAANTDFTLTHNLGYIPITIVGQDTNNGGLLYRSPSTAWTKTQITLRCSTAAAAYNLIIA